MELSTIPKLYLVTGIDDDNEPEFGQIVAILVLGRTAQEIKFVVKKCSDERFFFLAIKGTG